MNTHSTNYRKLLLTTVLILSVFVVNAQQLLDNFNRSSSSTVGGTSLGLPTMPESLRRQIAADVKSAMESDPVIKDRLTRTGQLFAPGGPAEFQVSIEHQRATVAAAASAIGLKAAKQ